MEEGRVRNEHPSLRERYAQKSCGERRQQKTGERARVTGMQRAARADQTANKAQAVIRSKFYYLLTQRMFVSHFIDERTRLRV